MSRRFTTTLTFQIVVLLALCAGTAVFAAKGEWLLSVSAGTGTLIAVLFLYRLYGRNARKIAFMFDAIENDDYTIKFSSDVLTGSDRMVNRALNRMKDLLAHAKTEMAEQEKYYELIMNSVSTGIIVVSEGGHIFQTNSEALRLLGLPVFTHLSQLKRIDNSLFEALENAEPGDKSQVSFVNERGTVTLSVRASELKIRRERLRLIAINDIDRELDEKELDSWIRLIRVLTHEIMNSITPVTSLSDTLLELHSEADPEIRNGLQLISETGKNLISFVESYRKFTRIPTPQPGLFYVEKFMARMVGLARHQENAGKIMFRVDVQPSDLIVYADERLISQVILNLLKNSVEAIGDRAGGLIEIKARCSSEEEVIIEISDNGDKIPPDIAEHIFIPFFTTKEGGSGIGLSVSRQIMRLSGGTLSLKSSSSFTTFVLTFK